MRTIHLHGSLKRYGATFELEVETAGEAVRALCTNFPDMLKTIREGEWYVIRGKNAKKGLSLGEEEIAAFRLGSGDLHIMPAIKGAKQSGGVLKVVLGVALIAFSFGSAAFLGTAISGTLLGGATWGNAIGMLGLSMLSTGISSMLAPEKKSSKSENSFIFSGPQNGNRQGTAVPIVYGEVITGGVMISGGLDVGQIPV